MATDDLNSENDEDWSGFGTVDNIPELDALRAAAASIAYDQPANVGPVDGDGGGDQRIIDVGKLNAPPALAAFAEERSSPKQNRNKYVEGSVERARAMANAGLGGKPKKKRRSYRKYSVVTVAVLTLLGTSTFVWRSWAKPATVKVSKATAPIVKERSAGRTSTSAAPTQIPRPNVAETTVTPPAPSTPTHVVIQQSIDPEKIDGLVARLQAQFDARLEQRLKEELDKRGPTTIVMRSEPVSSTVEKPSSPSIKLVIEAAPPPPVVRPEPPKELVKQTAVNLPRPAKPPPTVTKPTPQVTQRVERKLPKASSPAIASGETVADKPSQVIAPSAAIPTITTSASSNSTTSRRTTSLASNKDDVPLYIKCLKDVKACAPQ